MRVTVGFGHTSRAVVSTAITNEAHTRRVAHRIAKSGGNLGSYCYTARITYQRIHQLLPRRNGFGSGDRLVPRGEVVVGMNQIFAGLGTEFGEVSVASCRREIDIH